MVFLPIKPVEKTQSPDQKVLQNGVETSRLRTEVCEGLLQCHA